MEKPAMVELDTGERIPGVLTTERAESSYGIPVFVPNESRGGLEAGTAYGKDDIKALGVTVR